MPLTLADKVSGGNVWYKAVPNLCQKRLSTEGEN